MFQFTLAYLLFALFIQKCISSSLPSSSLTAEECTDLVLAVDRFVANIKSRDSTLGKYFIEIAFDSIDCKRKTITKRQDALQLMFAKLQEKLSYDALSSNIQRRSICSLYILFKSPLVELLQKESKYNLLRDSIKQQVIQTTDENNNIIDPLTRVFTDKQVTLVMFELCNQLLLNKNIPMEQFHTLLNEAVLHKLLANYLAHDNLIFWASIIGTCVVLALCSLFYWMMWKWCSPYLKGQLLKKCIKQGCGEHISSSSEEEEEHGFSVADLIAQRKKHKKSSYLKALEELDIARGTKTASQVSSSNASFK